MKERTFLDGAGSLLAVRNQKGTRNLTQLTFHRDLRNEPVLQCRTFEEQIPYLTFPKLEACEKVDHLFTTRLGGVSEGQFYSMNFSVKLGDSKENVQENYRRISRILKGKAEDITGTVQTHTTNIRRVTSADRGKVACIPADYDNVDGLVTNEKGLILAAYTADCVPIFFVDPKREAVGLAHSGWRGTVHDMAGKMVRKMTEEFGTDPKDLIVAIGPSICRKCYEVDEEVANEFRKALGDAENERELIARSGAYPMENGDTVRTYWEHGREKGKYQLDLWLSNLIFLVRAGVQPGNVDVTDLCTAENAELLFSHRASAGKRGNMGAFLKLVE